MAGVGTRIARNPETGKTYNVPSDMTYEQWFKSLPKSNAEAGQDIVKNIDKIVKYDYNDNSLTAYSLRFMSNRDDTFKNMVNVPPLDGYEDVVCHSDASSFSFQDPDTGEVLVDLDAKRFAELVKSSEKYNGGPIRLIACEAGKNKDGLAQQFANEMGVRVLAPTKIAYSNSQGYIVLADDVKTAARLLKSATDKWNSNGWKEFIPKGE